jgi:copper oxidase (laccase) domain-containing protein
VGRKFAKPLWRKIRKRSAFRPAGEKYFADIYQLARQRLANVGVTQIFGGDRCTSAKRMIFLLSSRQDHGSYGKFHLADIT